LMNTCQTTTAARSSPLRSHRRGSLSRSTRHTMTGTRNCAVRFGWNDAWLATLGANPAMSPPTQAAGRLPGLGLAVHQNTPEGTAVEVLPAGAVAHAAAALVPRWLAGELPRTHLDAALPFPPAVSQQPPAEQPKASTKR